MFGLFKKSKARVTNVMEQQHIAMTLFTATYLKDKLGKRPELQGMSDEVLMGMAGPVTNLIFGRKDYLPRGNPLDSPTVESIGRELLEEDDILKEVAIQSCRVLSTLMFTAYGKTDVLNEFMTLYLRFYGDRFPSAPDPSNYPILINKLLLSMQIDSREKHKAIMQALIDNGWA